MMKQITIFKSVAILEQMLIHVHTAVNEIYITRIHIFLHSFKQVFTDNIVYYGLE